MSKQKSLAKFVTPLKDCLEKWAWRFPYIPPPALEKGPVSTYDGHQLYGKQSYVARAKSK